MPSPGPAWVLIERAQGSPLEVSLDGVASASCGAGEGVELSLRSGAHLLEVRQGPVVSRWCLEVGQRDVVADGLRWARLVSSLEARLPAQRGAPPPDLWVRAALAMMPAWSRALSAVAASPRRRARDVPRLVPLSRLRQVDSALERWFARHPAARQALREPDAGQHVMDSMTLLSVDHPANRTTALWIERVVRALEGAQGALAVASPRGLSEVAERAPVLLIAASSGALSAARSWRRRGPWRGVSSALPDHETLMALLDDPLYARVHRLSRALLSSSLLPRWGEGVAWRASGESVSLYGVWAFLELCEVLARHFSDWSWRRVGFEALWADEEGQVRLEGRSQAGDTLALWWRPGFVAVERGSASPRRDLSGVGGAPLALTAHFEGSAPVWMALSSGGDPEGAGLRARRVSHERREGLWWEGFGGRPVGSAWLDDGGGQRPSGWGDEEFWRRYGVGWSSLVPGESRGQSCLAHWMAALKPRLLWA